jgi:3-oxoacyl-[acyl-carrier protein] reductase
MSASLVGKSVVATGGSKGIGKSIARVFAGHGAKVLIVARHLKDAAYLTGQTIIVGRASPAGVAEGSGLRVRSPLVG